MKEPPLKKKKSSMESLLIDCVNRSLHLYMLQNASFLCERLCAQFPSEVNLQLLARCYLQSNQAYRAYHILKGTHMAQSRYLFAISCFQMDLLQEAEAALCPSSEHNNEVANGAAGHYLLGLIYRYTDRRKLSVEQFMQALSIDPFLWAAYEELCILGAAEEPVKVFGESALQHHLSMYLGSHNLHIASGDHKLVCNKIASSDEASPKHLKQSHVNYVKDTAANLHGAIVGPGHVLRTSCGSSNVSLFNTPSPVSVQLSGVAPPPVYRNMLMQPNASTLGEEVSPKSTINPIAQAPRRKLMDGGKFRKISGRLFSDSAPRRSTTLAGETVNLVHSSSRMAGNGTTMGGNGTTVSSTKILGGLSSSKMNSPVRSVTVRKRQTRVPESVGEVRLSEAMSSCPDDIATSSMPIVCEDKPCDCYKSNNSTRIEHGSRFIVGAEELLGLLRVLGEGYRLSRMYKCQEAVESFLKLPPQHYATGWVLSQVGKAHTEMVNYLEADLAFSWARRVSPHLLDGMDAYSTVLFHLKEEMKLSYLAKELVSIDRLSPQAWCATGNCCSLQKDHETALKSFQRAIHLNSRFTYAHTLCGHEYVSMEDFENGVKCYQSALRIDSRHYNAWYGLGMIYFHQEKFAFAEHHFRSAFQINPRSSVLMCYLGMALHALKLNEEALDILERAISADRRNPLPMYERANILSNLERYDEALEHLEELKEFAPCESSLYALMGKIYKRLNQHAKAIFHFGIALDLKPPDADVASIKSVMEKLHMPDELQEL